ncbi:MAG: restriction endonuclease [Burkholderiaceae bacterium]
MSSHRISTTFAGRAQQQSFAQSALVGGTLLLLLAVVGGWLLGLGHAIMLATALVIVVLTLSVIGLQLAFASRDVLPVRARVLEAVAQQSAASEQAAQDDPAHEPLQGKRWSLDVFASIDAQRFAAVCETWFSWAGFDTRYEAHRTNEGVDIWLHAARLPGPVAIVRCKHTQDKPVGLREMQEFQGVVANCKSAHGTFTTTSTYTPEALQFAREHDIEAVDGKALLRRIMTRTRQSQQALLAVAYHGR